MFKKMRSRKFFVLILFVVVVWLAYLITLVADQGSILNASVFITIVGAQAFFGAAYIGGNVLQKYIEMRTGKSSEPRATKPAPTTSGSALDRIKMKGG